MTQKIRLRNKNIRLQRKVGNSMKKFLCSFICIFICCTFCCGCSKDEVLYHYNNVIESAGSLELTNDFSLKGTRKFGEYHYTGSYTADYKKFTGKEYVFGGTSINNKDISISCSLEITKGTAKVFLISGSNKPTTLIESSSSYNQVISLPNGGNYIGIEGDSFNGNIKLNIK